MTELSTVADVVAALGGERKVAELLGVSVAYIHSMNDPRVNRIPERHVRTIARALPSEYTVADVLYHRRRRPGT